MLGLTNVLVFTFRPLQSPAALPPAWQPVTAKTYLRAGGVLRDLTVFFVVVVVLLTRGRETWGAWPAGSLCL
eukprot:3970101-Prymnesium_polylepis.1